MLTIIATATASDEIGPWAWQFAWVCLLLAAVLALSALIGSIVSCNLRQRPAWLALAGGLISLVPLGFAFYVYRIDYVAVGGDGTPASAPLWRALIWPAAPLFVALLAAFITFIRREEKGSDPAS